MSTQLKTRPPNHLPIEMADDNGTPAHFLESEVPQSPKGIYNSQQQPLVLGNKIGVGGEGTVYDIQGQPDLVAKIYHEMPAPEKAEKLIAMAKLGTERLFKISAWPVDVLRDTPEGNVIGFVMHKIGQAEEVHTLHSPKSRLKKFPDASWSFLIHVATNIARAVAALHEHGFVIGDVNPKNILVTKKATVYLLDCDSFQLSAEGKTYRCEGGFPEYTPPELQGIPFSEIDRNQEHDCFGLAVVIFQLLFLGRHPYSGRSLGVGEMPLEKAIQEGRFAYGTDAAQRQMQPPPGTLSFDALPVALTELLRRAFLATDRPDSHEWIAPLTKLANSLQRCVMHSGHYYHESLTECPWCQIEARARIRLFNFNPGEARQYPSAFRLDEIWAEAEKLQTLAVHGQNVTAIPQLSPAVIEYTKQRRIRSWLAILFAALGGIFSALVGGFYAAFWLLPIVLLSVKWIAGTNKQRDDKSMQTLFTAQFDLPDHPLAKRIVEQRKEAEDYIQATEPKLVSQKEAQAYSAKVQDLNSKLWDYEALSETDNRKFQLEHEITSSTQYLRQLKQQLEAQQQQFLPALTKAKQAVTEADKNLEVLSWRNSGRPIIITLILAFVLTLIWVDNRASMFGADSAGIDHSAEYQPPPPPPINNETTQPKQNAADPYLFNEYYKEGKKHLAQKNFPKAKALFLTAAELVSEATWNQQYASLYYDLSCTLQTLGEASGAIKDLEIILYANPTDDLKRFRLTLLHALVGRGTEASEQYRILSERNETLAESLKQVMRVHGVSIPKPASQR